MKISMKKIAFVIPALLMVANSQTAHGQDSRSEDSAEQINQANVLVRDGKFDEAIQKYDQVQPSAINHDDLDYNLAVAQFRKGEVDIAEELFTVAATSTDANIAANSRYNLGNCLYSKALGSASQDKTVAIEQLREAISHYRDSLRLNEDNADARANIELAGELIRKLQEEQKQEEQQQEQQNQDKQKQDQKEQAQNQKQNQPGEGQNDQQDQNDEQKESDASQSEDQQSNGDQSNESQQHKSKSGEQSSDQQNTKEDQSPGDEQSRSQQDDNPSEQSTENSESLNQSQNKKPESDSQDQKSQEQESEAQQDQQKSDQQSPAQPQDPENGKPSNQSQQEANQASTAQRQSKEESGKQTDQINQTVPTGDLTAGQQDENEKPNGSIAIADPNAEAGMMSKEEALKMLQSVRDRDMLRRLRQEQAERSRHVPVDRDW